MSQDENKRENKRTDTDGQDQENFDGNWQDKSKEKRHCVTVTNTK